MNIRSSLLITILFLFMQKLRKRLTLTSVLAGRKALRMRQLAMLATAIFDHLFYKKQYLSNGQAICREISHKHCK